MAWKHLRQVGYKHMLIKVQAPVTICSCILISGHYSTVEDHQTNITQTPCRQSFNQEILVASAECITPVLFERAG